MIYPEEIVEAVCAALHVTDADLRSSKRDARSVLARRIIASLMRRLIYRVSLPDMAEYMGRPTHSSIVSMLAAGNSPARIHAAIAANYDAEGNPK